MGRDTEEALHASLQEVEAMIGMTRELIQELERTGGPAATGRELLKNLEQVRARYEALLR
jgi:hypothetical protein